MSKIHLAAVRVQLAHYERRDCLEDYRDACLVADIIREYDPLVQKIRDIEAYIDTEPNSDIAARHIYDCLLGPLFGSLREVAGE